MAELRTITALQRFLRVACVALMAVVLIRFLRSVPAWPRGDEYQTQERLVHSALFEVIMLGQAGACFVLNGSRTPSWRRLGIFEALFGTALAALAADMTLSGWSGGGGARGRCTRAVHAGGARGR